MSFLGEVIEQQSFDDVASDENLETIECIVKWFNPVKGYGFVVPKMGAEDIFMHFSVVDAAGFQHLGTGTELLCNVGFNATGRQVKEIVEVRKRVDGIAHQGPGTIANRSLLECEGEVKWFNTLRGFGFIMPDNGEHEVFVHSSVLRRHGIDKINPGERVRMQVAVTDQGPQAWSIAVISRPF